jgi:hypothetical protein
MAEGFSLSMNRRMNGRKTPLTPTLSRREREKQTEFEEI